MAATILDGHVEKAVEFVEETGVDMQTLQRLRKQWCQMTFRI
jgi:hypothetical protein